MAQLTAVWSPSCPTGAATCSEAGLAPAASVLSVRSDLPGQIAGAGRTQQFQKKEQRAPGPRRQVSPGAPPPPARTHLPCRRRRSFFSSTHSRLFLTTPRLAILKGTLWGGGHSYEPVDQAAWLAPQLIWAGRRGSFPPNPVASDALPQQTSPFWTPSSW